MLIDTIKNGKPFTTINGIKDVADGDAHWNEEEECWIVYGETGESYFEEDFIPPIENVMKLSLSHLSPQARDYLKKTKEFLVAFTDKERRCIISIMPSMIYDDMPEDLKAAVELAVEYDCTQIEFSYLNPTIGYLKTYD